MDGLIPLLTVIGQFLFEFWRSRKERQHDRESSEFDKAMAIGDSSTIGRLLSQL